MTHEELERAMEFIVAQTAKNSVELQKLLESHRMAEHRLGKSEYQLDRVERILKLMVRAGRRERQTRSETDERLTSALAELAQSMAHTDSKLDALIDIVRQRNGG